MSALLISALVVADIGRVFLLPVWLQVGLIAAATTVYAANTRSAGRFLFILLLLLVMVALATTELGTDSWMTSLLEPEMAAMGLHPGWVLVYNSALMMVLRLSAGPLVRRFSPLGLLAICSAIAGVGLYGLSMVNGAALLIGRRWLLQTSRLGGPCSLARTWTGGNMSPRRARREGRHAPYRGRRGLLWYTKEKFRDAEIHVWFKLAMPDANSG